MKTIGFFILTVMTLGIFALAGCAGPRVTMPTMDLPPEPTRPAIKSSVIVQNSIPYVSYTVPEALRLYEYLVRKDAYEEQLKYRILQMNSVWQGK